MTIDIIYMWINKYEEKQCVYYNDEESNEG
jgi:hypothetical protein